MSTGQVRVTDADPEMLAIKAVLAALAPLDAQAASRVLGWAEARYGVEAQRIACGRLNESLMASLELTAQGLRQVDDACRSLTLKPEVLKVVLGRLADEVSITEGAG